MAENDGGVVLDVVLSVDDADKELGKLAKKATALEDKLRSKKDALAPAVENAKKLGAELDVARAKLESMKSSGSFTSAQMEMQKETVKSLGAQFNIADANAQRLSEAVEKTTAELASTKRQYGEVAKQAQAAKKTTLELPPAVQKIESRIKRLAQRVLFFSVVTAGLRELRSWMSSVIKTDKDATAAIARLKGALLTLAQPLVNVVIPAFTDFLRILTSVVTAMADVVSTIMGTTVEESADAAENLNDEKKALAGVGSAAKKASKDLANFDEINKLSGSDRTSGGSSSASTEIAPDFSGLVGGDLSAIEAILGGSLLALGAILTFSGANVPLGLGLMAVGAASLATAVKEDWSAVSQALRGPIGAITGILSAATLALGAVLLFSNANRELGLGLMVVGAAGLATTIAANWNSMPEGVRMVIGTLTSILSVAMLALGGALAFSGVNIPLGLGLIAAGAAGLVTAMAANWGAITRLLEGPLGAITGLLSVALLAIGGVLLFSTTNIGLGLALLAVGAAGLVSSVAANWGAITEMVKGPIGVLFAILSTAFLVIGGILAFSGVALGLGIALMVIGAVGLAATVSANWNTITEALGGPINAVFALVSGALLVLGAILLFSGANMGLGLGLLVAGGVGLATALNPNWGTDVLNALKGAWEAIKEWWSSNVAKFFTKEYWADLGSRIIDGLLSGLKKAFESVKSWANDAFGWLSGKASGAGSGISSSIGSGSRSGLPSSAGYRAVRAAGVSLQNVPRLATGAVIPPNREFAAVLGDQTHGNNLEAPEGLIRQIVREESGGNYTSLLQQILAAIKEGKVMVVDQTVFAQIVSASMDSEDFRRGSPMVTLM